MELRGRAYRLKFQAAHRPALCNLRVVMGKFVLRAIGLVLGVCVIWPLSAQEQKPNDGLKALVAILSQSDDPQFQFDILKGMSDGLKGRRGINMPAGWED